MRRSYREGTLRPRRNARASHLGNCGKHIRHPSLAFLRSVGCAQSALARASSFITAMVWVLWHDVTKSGTYRKLRD
jgi:hypothetical protein